jgi:hypothetical protein
MKFIVDTPAGSGLMVKAFNKHRKRYIRVKFTNKDLKRKSDTRVFLYSECKIRKAPGPIMRWLKKILRKLN